MKKLALILAILVLAGCSDKTEEVHYRNLPSELVGCRFFFLAAQRSDVPNVIVSKCPIQTDSEIKVDPTLKSKEEKDQESNNAVLMSH